MVIGMVLGFVLVLFIASFSLLKNTKVKDKETAEKINNNFLLVWIAIIVITTLGLVLYYFG